MAERSIIDQVDDVVAAILAQRKPDLSAVDPAVVELAALAEELRGLPRDDFRKQLRDELTRSDDMSSPKTSATYIREGFHTVTPYLSVERAPELLEFVKKVFGATETFQTIGSAGGMHAEVRIGDSMVMIGGAPGIPENPTAIHLYIPDVDAAYQRAVDAGATSLFEPADMPYGERAGAVEDPFGNRWYIATTFGPLKDISEYLHTVTQYLHPIGAQRLIDFLKNAFSAEEVMRHEEPAGMILHAKMRIGDSVVELGEARTPSQPMPSTIYMYVEDCDALYEQALKAGGVSVLPPTDQPYGDRNAWVKDPFDNVWYLATHLSK